MMHLPVDPVAKTPSSDLPRTERHCRVSDLVVLTLAAGILFTVSLGARDLWNPNEPIYGTAVAEMEARGDWLIPTVNDRVFAEKPILYYWGALAASKVFGEVDEFTLRVPSALAGIASVLLTYLLVLPYMGRRRALLAALLFMTLYQVFWASRSVQMDVLVLASTLGVLVPLSRLVDFESPPVRAYALAGLAAGFGFLAKGPVSWVVPGLAFLAYAAWRRRLGVLFHPAVLVGVAAAALVCAPWYLLLWQRGETDFLYEVLFRQNFTRFVNAWDHQQPWWYYLEYLWIDYAPWVWLLPAAFLIGLRDDSERKLRTLAGLWIVSVIAFFSLSESKRAPYILPVAPAVAILAASVVDRWIDGLRLERRARIAAVAAFSLLALVFVVIGGGAAVQPAEIPEMVAGPVLALGPTLLPCGLLLVGGLVLARRYPALAPGAAYAGILALYLVASIWVLPAADPLKSAREFSEEMNQQVEASGGTVRSFRFWNWRSGYSYYSGRAIHDLESPQAVLDYWNGGGAPHILVEVRDEPELRALLPDAEIVHTGRSGSRKAFLYARPSP